MANIEKIFVSPEYQCSIAMQFHMGENEINEIRTQSIECYNALLIKTNHPQIDNLFSRYRELEHNLEIVEQLFGEMASNLEKGYHECVEAPRSVVYRIEGVFSLLD